MGTTISTFRLLKDTQLHPHTVSPHYLTSTTINLINPRKCKGSYETVSLYLPAEKVKHLSDERILAMFTKGFFGGWVFRFESLLTRAGGWKIMGPPKFPGSITSSKAKEIWNVATIPKDKVLPMGSNIVGSFQVLSSHLFTAPHHHPQYSYIDFSFGSSLASFAGNHQFVVRRGSTLLHQHTPGLHSTLHPNAAEPDDDELLQLLQNEMADMLHYDQVEIRLEGYHCNPLKDGFWAGKRLWFHEWYARALFVNGVRSVLAGAEAAKLETKNV